MAVDTLHYSDFSGQTIKGYELRERIGKGGFGAVYRAYQPAVRREVAVKVILPEYVNNPEFIRRFEAEAQLIAHLEHIHIVPLYDYWRDSDGAFLVMRWLKGGSLRAALSGGLWPLTDILRLVDQISSALMVAHHNGVIHRDLKPDNILLDEEKNAYLADFGIARDLQNFTQLESLYLNEQQQGQMLGSPHYLSPEQIKSEPISPQSDIYSFGIVLYELLTGKTPFEGLPLSTIITKHLTDPLPPLHEVRADLPEALGEVITTATAKDPADRYPSVLAFNADFRRALMASDAHLLQGHEPGKIDTAELARLGIITEPLSPGLEGVEPTNPYKGLRSFQEADARNFFGRAAFTSRLVERLGDAPFLAVVGPSGSGKSSAVKAGLIPALREGGLPGSSNWFILEMTPGTHPLEELEAALLRVAVNPPASLLTQLNEDERGLVRAVKRVLPGGAEDTGELLLVIDQFEEAFTQAQNEAERAQFLRILLEAARDTASRLRIVTTLRADFYDRPLLYPEFGELMREGTEVILPLKREELEQAIVQPAENVGLALEVGLVAEILSDVAEQPGSLPLLQYALTELFERRDGRWLTLSAYREIGGVAGALTRRADDIYDALDEEGKRAVRQMFLRLVTINEGADDTRRRVRQTELLELQGDESVMRRVIDLFGKYRLLTFDHDQETRVPTVEVAHEALIRQWGRLRGWIEENREGLRIQRRLMSAAEEWRGAGKDPSYLASGTRLDQFEAWANDTELALTGDEFEYLDASLAARVEQQAAEEARKTQLAAAQQRSRNFLRALAGVLAVATVGALILSAFALNQSRIAEANAVTATIAEGMALVEAENAATAAAVAQLNADQARSLAFASGSQLALNSNNTDLALLLAMEANQGGQSTEETRRILAEAAYAPGTRRVFTGHTDRATSVAYSPDGTRAASGARDDTVIIWDVETGAEIRRLEGHEDWVWDVAYSPDGGRILSASQDGTLILWDAETGELLRYFEGHAEPVRSVAFSSDGTQAISGSTDNTLILWDVETGEIIRQIENNSPIFDVAFGRSGVTAVSGGDDGIVTVWNVQTGVPIFRLGAEGNGHTSQVWSVAYTPDEMGVLSASDDSTLILWSLETVQPARRFVGHNSRVTSLAISPDGQTAVSGSEDNAIIQWDLATGGILRRFMGHTFLVYGVAYSPDGQHILSASWDTTIRLWDLENGAQVQKLENGATVLGVAFSPDGGQVLSASEDNTLVLWDTATGQEIRRLEGHTAPVEAVAFSPDGMQALSGSDDLSVILWDVATGSVIRRMGGAGSDNGHSDSVWALAFSPDGTRAVSGGRDNTLIIWDLETGEQLQRLFGHTFHITGLDFSPDGSHIISSAFDNVLILWDAETGEAIRRFEGHLDWIRSVVFSPDGKTVLSSSADNALILWDVATGKRLRQYEGHTAQVYSVAFSPTGQYAVSGSADADVILWDVASGAVLRRFTGHTDDVRSVAFSPDERYVLSGSGDGTVRMWQISLSLDDLTAWIQANRYIRDLTCAERERYNAAPLCPTPTPVLAPGSV
jgi:WD40 repeat protein/serine/threonine protein kinase